MLRPWVVAITQLERQPILTKQEARECPRDNEEKVIYGRTGWSESDDESDQAADDECRKSKLENRCGVTAKRAALPAFVSVA